MHAKFHMIVSQGKDQEHTTTIKWIEKGILGFNVKFTFLPDKMDRDLLFHYQLLQLLLPFLNNKWIATENG
jgi:hypothetical protein